MRNVRKYDSRLTTIDFHNYVTPIYSKNQIEIINRNE